MKSCPIIQNKPQSLIPNAIQIQEYHLKKKKQLASGRTLSSLVKKSQHVFSQVTPNLPQGNRSSQAHISVSIIPRDLISPEVWEKLEYHLAKRFMQ